jgi:flagellar basal-body rod protein FlgB
LSGGLAGSGLLYATPSQTNLDRNTVDMDRERASFADNAVKYEATLRFINGNVRTSLSAITGQ